MDLTHHGDAELAPGLVDLAVNVRHEPLPSWLAEPLAEAIRDLSHYPDLAPARTALAARHGRSPAEILLTAGAAEAFTLIAHALRGIRRAVVVHPQFTEPEVALWAAGQPVQRILLPPPFTFDPSVVPPDADLVVVGNPTNPTSVLHPAAQIASLARPGRVLVVDEAFAPTVPGEPQSLAAQRGLPGLVVVRSLTKIWGLAGLRIGYLLAAPELVSTLAKVQQRWPVSTPALAAALACASPAAVVAEREVAQQIAAQRAHLVAALRELPGVAVVGEPASAFVLIQVRNGRNVWAALRARGYAVRRGDTFPGLGPDWLRITVRDTATIDAFIAVLREVLEC